MVPLGQLAKVEVAKGAPGIRTENALLGLHLRRHPRPRHRRLRRRRQEGGRRQVNFPPGYYAPGAPVRVHGTRHRQR